MTESKIENLPTYAPGYKVVDYCLLETKNSKQGPYDRKLCKLDPALMLPVAEQLREALEK